ncbi:MAG: AMP-binding protein [Clostridia bacterium]|nr:AMP-binding protein [Clostridia bacterium]
MERKGFDWIHEVREIKDIKDLLYSGLKVFGENVSFKVKNKQTAVYEDILYKDYVKEVEALGTFLISLGLKDKKVVVTGENRYQWATSYMAVVNGVGMVVPVDKELPENEIINILESCKPSAIIYSGRKEDVIRSIAGKFDYIEYFIGMDLPPSEQSGKFISYESAISKGHELLSSGNRDYLDIEIDINKVLILLYTSATTSTSKAVMLTHHNLASNLMAMSSVLYIDPSDVFLSLLPLHHTYECTCGFLCPLYRGASIAYCEGLKYIVQNLKEAKATVMLGVPLLFEGMYKKLWKSAEKSGSAPKLRKAIKISNFLLKLKIDLRKKLFKAIYEGLGGYVRIFISGAAGISPEVAEFFRNVGLSFYQGYGLTECSPILALNSDTEFEDAAAGKALPDVEIQIWEPNSEGIGEIVAKGENIMVGYLNEEQLTREAFEGGFFHTGDMGYMDDRGFVYITGRKKSVIVTKNGKNIYPEEIESLINTSKYVLESMVFGKEVDKNDDLSVTLSVYPDLEAIENDFGNAEKATVKKVFDDLVREINKNLVNYKNIKEVIIRDKEFVKTTTSKIKRYIEENKA